MNTSLCFILICLGWERAFGYLQSGAKSSMHTTKTFILDVTVPLFLTKYSKWIVSVFHYSKVTSCHAGVVARVRRLKPVCHQVGVQPSPPAFSQGVPAVFNPADGGWRQPTDHALQHQRAVPGHCQALRCQGVKDAEAAWGRGAWRKGDEARH